MTLSTFTSAIVKRWTWLSRIVMQGFAGVQELLLPSKRLKHRMMTSGLSAKLQIGSSTIPSSPKPSTAVLSGFDEAILSREELSQFVELHYPHMVISREPDFRSAGVFTVTDIAGPARYTYNALNDQVYLHLPLNHNCYSRDGTWFFIANRFYFSNPRDAFVFKLRFG